MIFLMATIPMVSAEVYQQDEIIDLKIPCFNNDYSSCDSSTNCTITILYPNATIFVYQNMTYNTNYYNYTIQGNASALGTYTGTMACDGADEDGFYNFDFLITATGNEFSLQHGLLILGQIIFLIFLICIFIYASSLFGKEDKKGKKNGISLKIFFLGLASLTMFVLVGFILNASQKLISEFPTFISNYQAIYTLFIMLMTAGGIALIVWLIVYSLQKFNATRGFTAWRKDI